MIAPNYASPSKSLPRPLEGGCHGFGVKVAQLQQPGGALWESETGYVDILCSKSYLWDGIGRTLISQRECELSEGII